MPSIPLEQGTDKYFCYAEDINKYVEIHWQKLPKIVAPNSQKINLSCDNSIYCPHRADCNLHPDCPFFRSGKGNNFVHIQAT
jgi:hypothetical protein